MHYQWPHCCISHFCEIAACRNDHSSVLRMFWNFKLRSSVKILSEDIPSIFTTFLAIIFVCVFNFNIEHCTLADRKLSTKSLKHLLHHEKTQALCDSAVVEDISTSTLVLQIAIEMRHPPKKSWQWAHLPQHFVNATLSLNRSPTHIRLLLRLGAMLAELNWSTSAGAHAKTLWMKLAPAHRQLSVIQGPTDVHRSSGIL